MCESLELRSTTGAVGTARCQQQLKLVLMSTLALVMPHAGVLIGLAPQKFDTSGELVHEPTRQFIAAFLLDLEKWMHRCHDNVARP